MQTKSGLDYVELGLRSGADLRRKGADAPLLLPLLTQKNLTFVLFHDINFRLTDPKIFLQAPSVSIKTNFDRGNERQKNAIF